MTYLEVLQARAALPGASATPKQVAYLAKLRTAIHGARVDVMIAAESRVLDLPLTKSEASREINESVMTATMLFGRRRGADIVWDGRLPKVAG